MGIIKLQTPHKMTEKVDFNEFTGWWFVLDVHTISTLVTLFFGYEYGIWTSGQMFSSVQSNEVAAKAIVRHQSVNVAVIFAKVHPTRTLAGELNGFEKYSL